MDKLLEISTKGRKPVQLPLSTLQKALNESNIYYKVYKNNPEHSVKNVSLQELFSEKRQSGYLLNFTEIDDIVIKEVIDANI